jgi:hypothetical protein
MDTAEYLPVREVVTGPDASSGTCEGLEQGAGNTNCGTRSSEDSLGTDLGDISAGAEVEPSRKGCSP